ncbi:LysR family transcriptional regulator [Sediminicoccus rosea]|uniref:LysR family transcriptional regulator n=1 Tax=Sediminicoccus rosea TaxID=1225128 RepID=A0ABZ0PD95_9PROT|nr:LysR family transcriptional regulator [Sediminicoccus rosea]WPB83669.1 LysR family transcriptional regulator [Sediminicoccus rosea]
MDRLQTLGVFVAVAEAGSFTRAAARLQLSPPVVTRAVAALEERLGVRLLNRTTRSVVPTDAGLRLLESARVLLQQVDAAEREAVGETAAPSGKLTVSASVTFGRRAVAPIVMEFLRDHPRVSASLILVDRTVSLVEEGVDVAVRIGELPDSSLIARQIGRVQRLLVASPAYLARRGVPKDPADLRAHDVIAFTGLMPNREWRFVRDGRSAAVRFAPRIEVNDEAAAIAAAEAGDGITVSLCYMVAEALNSGRLVPVLHEVTPPPLPVQLVYPQARLVTPKVRAFVDLAARRLRERLSVDLAIHNGAVGEGDKVAEAGAND